MDNPVADLVEKWLNSLAELAKTDPGRPDITDHHGRVWTWWKGDLYRHCGLAVPQAWLDDEYRLSLPSQDVLDNQNYCELCAICLNGRKRNIKPCNPEWNCSHTVCKN